MTLVSFTVRILANTCLRRPVSAVLSRYTYPIVIVGVNGVKATLSEVLDGTIAEPGLHDDVLVHGNVIVEGKLLPDDGGQSVLVDSVLVSLEETLQEGLNDFGLIGADRLVECDGVEVDLITAHVVVVGVGLRARQHVVH